MSVFVLTWNLNRERANYATARQSFIKHLERYPNIADSGLESVRWIDSASSANEISADLRTKLDDNDCIFVTKLMANYYQGWLSPTTWTWINSRL